MTFLTRQNLDILYKAESWLFLQARILAARVLKFLTKQNLDISYKPDSWHFLQASLKFSYETESWHFLEDTNLDISY